MENPKISIIIPAYNAEKYIRQTVSSVLDQSMSDFEIIAVNDGSRDSTGEILDELAAKNEQIKVIHQKNRGLSAARNAGLEQASGTAVLFLDSDDFLMEDCLETAWKEMEQSNADLILFEHFNHYSRNSKRVQTYSQPRMVYDSQNQPFDLFDMRTITVWGKLYSRKLIENSRFDENMKIAEDVYFNYQIFPKASKAVYIDTPLMAYRILPNSAVHGHNPKVKEHMLYALEKIKGLKDSQKISGQAWYSFAAIAYIVICQNAISTHPENSLLTNMKEMRQLEEIEYFRDLFNHIGKISIPLSRKSLIFFGKNRLYFLNDLIIKAKVFNERRG